MSVTKSRITRGLILTPDDIGTEGIEGEIKVAATAKKLQVYLDAALRSVVTENQSQSLSNKTIVVASNIITTAASGNLAATELNAALSELQSSIDASDSGLSTHIANPTDAHDASAISSIPSGNLAATNAQAALNELQSDVDTRATSAALSAHESSTAVHGATGAVVGTTNTQTLTNKTLTAPVVNSPTGIVKADVGLANVDNTSDATKNAAAATLTNKIITGADFRTPIRSDVKQDIKSALVTYALTATNGQLVFATDEKLMYQVVDLALVTVGSASGGGGTGVDTLFTQTFETATLGNFTQTGLSLSSASPLDGSISALMTHQAGTPQSFKQIVPVYEKFRGLAMSLGLNVKSNATAGNVTISVYDETNAVAILASSQLTLSSLTGGIKNTVSFVIPATCLSMSYTVTALQQAGTPVTRVDDIICQIAASSLLETSVIVPKVTAWASYVPVLTGFGSATAIEAQYRQSGQNHEYRVKFVSGVSTAVEARISLANGATSANTSIIPSIQQVGSLARSAAVANSYIVLAEPSTAYLTFAGQADAGITKINGNTLCSTGQALSFFASVPISGLSATEAVTIPLTQSGVIQEADYTLRAAGNAGQAITANVTNIPYIAVSTIGSSGGSWNGSQFTVGETGIYSISVAMNFTAAAARNLALYIDGTLYKGVGDFITNTYFYGGITEHFTVGQVLSIRSTGAGTLINNAEHALTIAKQGSLKQVNINTNSKITIPTSELRFEGSSSRGTTATAIVKFDTMAKIRGDAFTVVSTTADGTFVTMTKAGKLAVSASIYINSASGGVTLTKNQSNLTAAPVASEILSAGGSTASVLSPVAWTGTVSIGDVIRVFANAAPTSNVTNVLNLSFQEQDIQVSVSNTLPQFSESDSSVRVNTANGYGSTATMVRRFSNISENLGVDITYADSATAGASFIVMESGTYNISYSDQFNGPQYMGISKNASALTTSVALLAVNERLAIGMTTAANYPNSVSWEGYLTAGDVIRPHTSSQPSGATTALSSFTMSKVGKPNVTGVDVTPFVVIPQPVKEILSASGGTAAGNVTVTNFSGFSTTNNGILSQTASRITANKPCTLSLSWTYIGAAAGVRIDLTKNGTLIAYGNACYTNTAVAAGAIDLKLEAGEYLEFIGANSATTTNTIAYRIIADALADQILTVPETFSTDTAPLTYAGSGTYTLATLNTAPVGTFITFSYAASTFTRTQTTTAPTQLSSSMNTNGILVYSRAYNAASTAALPSTVAIQIGKGHKGTGLNLYKALAKVTACNSDYVEFSTGKYGLFSKDYNEVTGILVMEAGMMSNSGVVASGFFASDNTFPTEVYIVINASKSPALTGLGISTVAARGVNTAGTSIANASNQAIVYDAAKTYDTHNALNSTTGVYTAPENGYYQIHGTVWFASAAYAIGNSQYASILKNGTVYQYGQITYQDIATSRSATAMVSTGIYLTKNETVALLVTNNRTAGATPLESSAGNYTSFSIHKTSV